MKHLITTSKSIALISFIIGTILFALQLYNSYSDNLIYTGIVFILIATIVNTIVLLGLIFSIFGTTSNKPEILKAIGLLLLNIPIAILYFSILITVL